ncbi:uncharacterized protein LOC144434318 [Glandiceps talaboti]
MFTKEEAVNFTENILRVKEPLHRFEENKLQLLNAVIRAYHNTIPFQNITLLCLDPMERRAPSKIEMKEDALSTVGGICPVSNTSMKFILEALGFHVYFVPANVTHPNNHFLFVVHDVVQEGDAYMVDVGCGYPTFEAIPLDFDNESPVYKYSFISLKLVRKDDIIERQHLRRTEEHLRAGYDPVHKNITGTWMRFYDFQLMPVDYSHFDVAMHEVYTIPGTSPFLLSLRLVTFTNDKCTAVRDGSLLEEGEDNCLREAKFNSTEEMSKCISKICPQLPVGKIEKALKYWENEIKPSLKK